MIYFLCRTLPVVTIWHHPPLNSLTYHWHITVMRLIGFHKQTDSSITNKESNLNGKSKLNHTQSKPNVRHNSKVHQVKKQKTGSIKQKV